MIFYNGQQVFCFLLRISSKEDLPQTSDSLRTVRSGEKRHFLHLGGFSNV